MKKNLILIILSFSFSYNSSAQQSTRWLLDELTTAQGQRKVEILTALSQQVEDHAKALNFANQALETAQGMNYQDGIAVSYICLGNLKRYFLHKVIATDSIESIANQHSATKQSIVKSNRLLSEVVFEGQTLKVENAQSLAQAESDYQKARETRRKQGNKDGEIWALKKLGELYESIQDYPKAEKYYLEWLQIRQNEGDKNKIAWAYTSLAEFYARNTKMQTDYAARLENALNERFKVNASVLSKEMQAVEFQQIAVFYDRLGETEKAENYHQKALTFFPKKEDNLPAYKAMWNSYLDKAKSNYEQSKFEQAEKNFQKYINTIYESEIYKKDINALPAAYMKIAHYLGYYENIVAKIQYQCKVLEMRIKENDSQKIDWQKTALKDSYSKLFIPQTFYRLENQYLTVRKNNQYLMSIFSNWQEADNIKKLNPDIRDSYQTLEKGTKILIGYDTIWLPKPAPLHYQNSIQTIENVLPIVKDKEITALLFQILAYLYEETGNNNKAILALQKLLLLKEKQIKYSSQKNIKKANSKPTGDTLAPNTQLKLDRYNTLVNIANLYEKQKDDANAIATYQNLANDYEKEKNWAGTANALSLIGQVYQKQENWQKMLAQYEKIIAFLESKKIGINGFYYVQSAIACKHLGKEDKAIKYAKMSLYEKKKFMIPAKNENAIGTNANPPISITGNMVKIPVNAFTDTFFGIKEKYGLTDENLIRLNPNIPADVIRGGVLPMDITELVIKGDASSINPRFVTTNPSSTPLTEERIVPRESISDYTRDSAKAILKELLTFNEVRDTTFIVHTVGENETLESITQLYGVSQDCLNQWNYLDAFFLLEGMKLKVCKKADWAKNIDKTSKLADNEVIYHTVSEYIEYTYNIFERYKLTRDQLNALNQRELPYSLERGQKIIVGIKVANFCECEE